MYLILIYGYFTIIRYFQKFIVPAFVDVFLVDVSAFVCFFQAFYALFYVVPVFLCSALGIANNQHSIVFGVLCPPLSAFIGYSELFFLEYSTFECFYLSVCTFFVSTCPPFFSKEPVPPQAGGNKGDSFDLVLKWITLCWYYV